MLWLCYVAFWSGSSGSSRLSHTVIAGNLLSLVHTALAISLQVLPLGQVLTLPLDQWTVQRSWEALGCDLHPRLAVRYSGQDLRCPYPLARSLSSRSILWLPAYVPAAQPECFTEQESNGRAQPSLSPLWIRGCSSCTLIQFSLSGLFPVLGLRVLLKLLRVTGPDASACIWRHFHGDPTRVSPGHNSSSRDCLTH